MDPQDGDIIKGQKGVAYYDEYEWIGSLKTLVPGKGYKTKNTGTDNKSFHYPASAANNSGARLAPRRDDISIEPSTFTPVDFHAYPANMVVCVQVAKNGQPVEGIEVGIFADNECREASVTDDRGMIYVTVPGNESVKLIFRVTDGTDIYDAAESVTYKTDAVLGTPKAPLMINLDNATGIKSISDVTVESMYDISGRKVADSRRENRSLSRGVYIIRSTQRGASHLKNGQKVVVK